MEQGTRFHPRREYQTEPSEDSDLIVALFRFGLIIAFTAVTYTRARYIASIPVAVIVAIAALYSLGLMIVYLVSRRMTSRRARTALAAHPVWGPLTKRRLGAQRVAALAIDLALITAIIYDRHYLPLEFLGLYYIVVSAGALWFHRTGGILCAFAASLCMVGLVAVAGNVVRDIHQSDPYQIVAPRAVIAIAIGLIVGYLARAREAERRVWERHGWELNLARHVQSQMLPDEMPTVPGIEVAARFESARVVGGDYYDVTVAPDGRLIVVIADVAGKSVYAAMHLSLLRSHLHESLGEGLGPAAIAERVNSALVAVLPAETFISLFITALDGESGELSYANCGHTPPLIATPGEDGPSRELFSGHIVLGVLENPGYAESTDTLGVGECLVMCTDGISESMGADWVPLGMEGVAEAVASAPAEADAIADAVAERARAFSERAAPDDATVLVVHRPAEANGAAASSDARTADE